MIKKFAWSGAAVLLALVMALGLVTRPVQAAAPTTVNVLIDDANATTGGAFEGNTSIDTINQPLTDVTLVPIYVLVTDGTAGTSMADETIVTLSSTVGTFLTSGESTEQVQCAIDDVAVAAAARDGAANGQLADENLTFSVTSGGAYNGEAEVAVTDDLVAEANEEGCIGVSATLIVPKDTPTGQIIVSATTTNGKTASEILTVAAATSTDDPAAIAKVSGQPTYNAIGYTSSVAQFNPVANGTRFGVQVTDSDGQRVNNVTIRFTTDAGVLTDDDADDTGTGDIENACDSTTNMGTTVFAVTSGTGTSGGRAFVILCGTSGSAGKTATITARVETKPSISLTEKVTISGKPASSDIKATVTGNTVNVEVMVGGVPAPDNTNVRFSVVPSDQGTVASSCVSLEDGKASTSFAATPGQNVTILVTATEPVDPGATNNATNETATLCGTTDGRTYGSTSVSTAGTGGTGGTGNVPATGTVTSGSIPAAGGFGLIVYGGPVNQLPTATGCPAATSAFWATIAGNFVTYVPGTTITAVNADFMAAFPNGIPSGTPLIGKCK